MKAYILYFIAALLFAIAATINVLDDATRKSGYFMFVGAAAMIIAGIANYKRK